MLSLLSWMLAGVVMGALANAAHWGIGAYRPDLPRPLLLTLGLGLLTGVSGGWLGSIFFGDLFSLPAALALGGLLLMLYCWRIGKEVPHS